MSLIRGTNVNKAKIVGTIGPASRETEVLVELGAAGLDVCRLNASFGTHDERARTIANIRTAEKKVGKPLGILMDLQGPKIRVGKLKEPLEVRNGDTLVLCGGTEHQEPNKIPTTYADIASDTEEGRHILLADGHISLQVQKTDPSKKEVVCRVLKGGTILTGKGINLPYTKISLPALTEKDCGDALFAMREKVDYIGLSFVRRPEDVSKLKALMEKEGVKIPIIAKIEKPEALDNFDAILEEVDGVMVARGDLAVEISFAKVPVVQKDILRRANRRGRLTIVATEMLNSMVDNPMPTRAEASDVANAVIDGTDAVMLSNETSIGKYPVLAVRAMGDIVAETEAALGRGLCNQKLELPAVQELTGAMCASASYLTSYLSEKATVIITHSGGSARILSKYRPDSMIVAGTFTPESYHRMALYHNVRPMLLDQAIFKDQETAENAIDSLVAMMRREQLAGKGDKLVFLTGNIKSNGWKVNSIKVVEVG